VGFVQGNAHRTQTGGVNPQLTVLDPRRDAIEDSPGQKFGGGVASES